LPEKVEDVAVPSEPEAKAEGTELEVEEVPSVQDEELVLPEREETAPVTEAKSEVKEPETAPAGEVKLANVPTKDLLVEVWNRLMNAKINF